MRQGYVEEMFYAVFNVPSQSLLSVRGMKGCVSSDEYYPRQKVLVFSPKIKVFFLKKKSSLRFLDFLFCSRNQTLPMLMQRKHVLSKLTQCATKQKYCAGVLSLLRGRAGALLRGNIGCVHVLSK